MEMNIKHNSITFHRVEPDCDVYAQNSPGMCQMKNNYLGYVANIPEVKLWGEKNQQKHPRG